MGTKLKGIVVLFFLVGLAGCAKLLPSSQVTVEAPWHDYDSTKLAYEKIIPGVTTLEDLKTLKFDPYIVPNIKILNATEVVNLFMPNSSIRYEDLDGGIQTCIQNKKNCTAYEISPGIKKARRVGNFWLDLFTFKRETVNTGWEFYGLITIVDKVVTYKDPAGGIPLIRKEEVVRKPLGPLQDAADFIFEKAATNL